MLNKPSNQRNDYPKSDEHKIQDANLVWPIAKERKKKTQQEILQLKAVSYFISNEDSKTFQPKQNHNSKPSNKTHDFHI